MEHAPRLGLASLLLGLLAACAAAPVARPAGPIQGSMGDGFTASAWSSEGPTTWSVARQGAHLLLERDGLRAEVRGFSARQPLDFEQDEGRGLWRFHLPDGRTLTWQGTELRLGDRVWRLAAGAPLLIDLGPGA